VCRIVLVIDCDLFLYVEFKKLDYQQSTAKNIVLMLVYTWKLGSRWYTSDLNVDSIDM